VFKEALFVMDLVLYLNLYALSKTVLADEDFAEWADSYGFHQFGFNKGPVSMRPWTSLRPLDVPVTWGFVQRNASQCNKPRIPARYLKIRSVIV
jgi:hypothetical protein